MSNPQVNDIVKKILTSDNIQLLTNAIISRNSVGINIDTNDVYNKVYAKVVAWINLGKFKTKTMQPLSVYNREFIDEFADTIIPIHFIKVDNPISPEAAWNGQINIEQAKQRTIMEPITKPIPFWRKSVFKRLHDRVRDDSIDETEDLFYKMDKTSVAKEFNRTPKKIPERTRHASILDRENLTYKM